MPIGRLCRHASALVPVVAGLGTAGVRWGAATPPRMGESDRPPSMEWVTFTDPYEQAFTIEVPKGWTAKGGLYRLGYSDHRQMIDLTSPDGRINVRIGDVAIPIYFLPTASVRQGEVMDLGAQARGTAAAYAGGQDFAARYGPARFRALCPTLTPRQADGTPPVPPYTLMPDEAKPQQSSSGQVRYDCGGGDASRVAYAYSETMLFASFWLVPRVVSFVAPPDQVTLARSILSHGIQTLHQLPAWEAKQRQYDQEAVVYQQRRQQQRRTSLQRQVAQFEANMQGMQSQVNSFEAGQARQAKQVEGMGNTLTGIVPTTDPYGNPRNVSIGPSSSYWINGATGETRNAAQSPGAGWQELTPTQ